MDATTPKLSGIKQYYDLGLCKSITQMGQHEDGLSLPSMSGASVGKINGWGSWNHLEVSSLTFWILGLVLAGISNSCWPEPLPVICLWATLWWWLTMECMNMHETQTCSSHLVRKGGPWKQGQNIRWRSWEMERTGTTELILSILPPISCSVK